MAAERVPRRLAAILAADVVGYSRLIRADEEGTLAALERLRTEIILPGIAAHGGRVFKLVGDGILAEFPSVVEAVRAAVEVQRALGGRIAAGSAARRIDLRIGVNLGDVIVDGDDLQGDVVNVASRLEGLAEPGGSACPHRPTSRFAIASSWSSRTWASGRSRTSTAPCACGVGRRKPRRRPGRRACRRPLG